MLLLYKNIGAHKRKHISINFITHNKNNSNKSKQIKIREKILFMRREVILTYTRDLPSNEGISEASLQKLALYIFQESLCAVK